MKERIGGIINEYCYVSPCDFSNITTTTNITGTSSSYGTTTTTDIPYNYTYITGDKITLDNCNGNGVISSNSTTGTNLISFNSDYFKSGLIKNLLDRIIEIKSLTKNSFYEIFDIKKISFLKDKTKIVCTKNIDINYLNELKAESVLLLECVDVTTDNYKERAIKHNDNLYSSSVVSGDGVIYWNGTGLNNTITISDGNLYNYCVTNSTSNTNNIIYC